MSRLIILFLFLALLPSDILTAGTKDVKIETVPSGAQVTVNGSVACTTLCSVPAEKLVYGNSFLIRSRTNQRYRNIAFGNIVSGVYTALAQKVTSILNAP